MKTYSNLYSRYDDTTDGQFLAFNLPRELKRLQDKGAEIVSVQQVTTDRKLAVLILYRAEEAIDSR